MLAHVGGDDSLSIGQLGDGLQDLIGGQLLGIVGENGLLQTENVVTPLGVLMLGQLLVQQLQHPAGVADDVVIGLDVLVDLGAVDVNLHDLGLVGKGLGAGGHAVREAAANGDQQVTLGGCDIGGVVAVHTDHAGELGVVARAGAAAHNGGGHGAVQRLVELAELLHGALGADDAAAHQNEGTLGLLDHVQQLVQIGLIGIGGLELMLGAAQQAGDAAGLVVLAQRQGLVVGISGGDILQNVDVHRAGTAGTGNGEGLAYHVGQLVRVLDQEVALGNGHGDAGDIDLLEGVLADQILCHVAGDEHNGGGVQIGGGDAGDQVGGAGAGGGETDAHLAGGAGITVRSVRSALLVGGEDVLDLLAVAVQLKLIVDVQDGTARIAEDGINALLQQAFHQNLGCCHSHGMISSFGNVLLDGSR